MASPFITPSGKPLAKLPENAYRAKKMCRIDAYRKPFVGPDYGIFIGTHRHPSFGPILMTWGSNLTRQHVEDRPGRKFVFIGLVGDGTGAQRENFEEVL